MKMILHPIFKGGFCLLFMLLVAQPSKAQVWKKLKEKAEKTVERKLEDKTERETSKTMDSILNPTTKGESPKSNGNKNDTNNSNSQSDMEETETSKNDKNADPSTTNQKKSIEVYKKFDFVPGDKLLFFDDFSNDFIGDFPAKWNTNGTGEVVSFNDDSGKWFEIKDGSNSFYVANINSLPEEYTIEFDIETLGLDSKTSYLASLAIIIDEKDNFGWGANSAYSYIPFSQTTSTGIRLWNRIANKTIISNTVDADLRATVLNRPHISIAVNKQRYRLFVNEIKYVDVPKMIAPGAPLNSLKFQVNNTKEGKERIFIKNIKIAEGGLDLRRTLIADGRVSTNGILFDSGSARIQPQSMGIILQISQVLQQENSLKLKIIGHTDADGDDAANLKLSKQRAEAVKEALISVYGVSADRLQSEGKGETTPLSDNNTPDGKAQNRRVEFVKI
jgi:outer membrane protein OmpA-like peptidoglycan-associated protein